MASGTSITSGERDNLFPIAPVPSMSKVIESSFASICFLDAIVNNVVGDVKGDSKNVVGDIENIVGDSENIVGDSEK